MSIELHIKSSALAAITTRAARERLHPTGGEMTIKMAVILATLSGGISACSGSDAEDSGGTTQSGIEACDAIDLVEPADGVQFKTALSLAAGEEREVCQLVKLDRDLNLNWSQGYYTTGSHHALVRRTEYKDSIPETTLDGQTLDGTKVHTCETPSALWKAGETIAGGRPVSQKISDSLDQGVLPEDVAFKLVKGEYVLTNFHMLNATKKPLTACYKANLHGIPAERVKREAGSIFWYNPFITVAGRSQSTARMACQIPENITLATSVSHAHKRLASYTASLLTGDPAKGGSEVRRLYEGSAWDTPPVNIFSPPLELSKGQWIDYQCHFSNPEDRNVAQGFHTTDEMCMFIGAYWPKLENFDFCGNFADSQAARVYGAGTRNGADVLKCFQGLTKEHAAFSGGGPASSADRFATLSCVTQACPEASAPIGPFLSACQPDKLDSPECVQAATALSAAKCN
jgi:hypothetical protein